MTTYSEKIRELQKRIFFDFNEDDYDTYFQLGTMLFDIGMCKEALDQFNTALYIYPESEEAIFMRRYTQLKITNESEYAIY